MGSVTAHRIDGFGGQVVLPEEPDYDATRAIWNAMHDARPALIARPESAQDVAAAIAHARANDLEIAVRAGGHSLPGHSVVGQEGMVIDLRLLNRVDVDPAARRARVGGGALLGDVDRVAQEHGLVVPAGVVSHTGAGGLTLGGGVGRMMRRHGLTIDSLLSAEVVTADGRILRASEEENADLFWGLRGGGGNFGIVTEFEFALHEVGDLMILFTYHPLDQARRVLEQGRAAMADPDAPDDLLWTSFVRKGPDDLPWMLPDLYGAPGVVSLIEWSGELEEGRRRLGQIRSELDPAASSLERVPFLEIQTATDDMFAHGKLSYVKAGMALELSDELIDALLARGEKLGSPLAQVEILAMGGAIARVDPDATAFPHRDARWLINVPDTWEDPAETEAEMAWVRETFAAIEPHLTGGAYVNFMEGDETAAADVAYGRTLDRLREVKRAYDPENVFRRNQNIEPAE
jgi:FAD/FMN-containing dehydrogenase